MELQVLQVLTLCMQAREKGHDCFFSYYPHVNSIDVQVFVGKWKKENDVCEKFMRCDLTTNQVLPFCDEAATVEQIIEYLTNLIKEEANG